MIKFLQNCVANPKTTATGVALIAAGATALINTPEAVAVVGPGNPVVLILTGIGFVLTADQNSKG